MKIHFVTHYQKLSEGEIDSINNILDTFLVHTPLELINLMFASAKRSHPGCKMTVLTNQSTQITGLPAEVELVRYPYDKYGNRLAEQLSIYKFLKEYKGESPIIFLDYDILIQESILPVFDKTFDLFLVRRQTIYSQKPPINMGIFGVQQNRYKQAARFINAIISQIIPFVELHNWAGSQLAVQKMLYSDLYYQKLREFITYNGILILLASGDYNYTPKKEDWGLFCPNKKVIHFKGHAKIHMSDYWEKYLKLQ